MAGAPVPTVTPDGPPCGCSRPLEADMSQYEIDGRPVPRVTEIIRDVLGGWFPSDPWYLERGTAVHDAMAAILRGKAFDCDPRIQGFVDAGRKFIADTGAIMVNVEDKVEGRVESQVHQFCGRFDAILKIKGCDTLIDWKTNDADDERVALQLGGYALALGKAAPRYGMGVGLHDDGTYKCTDVFDLRLKSREFAALRVVWGIQDRLGQHKQDAS